MSRLTMSMCALALCLVSCRSNAESTSSEEDSPASGTPAIVVKKGDVATMPGEALVEISNPEPIKDKASEKLSFGDTCAVEYKGELKVVGVDESAVLVEYKRSPSTKQANIECPNGTLLLIDTRIFGRLIKEYNQKKERLELVKKILGKK